MKNRYFAKEFKPGLWHVCDRKIGSKPIFDGDAHTIVLDEAQALDWVEQMNSQDRKESEE